MGNEARANLRRKQAAAEKQVHQNAVEKNLRLTLMNMRQLYNEETQKALGFAKQLDESRMFIAALAIEAGGGVFDVSQASLQRASSMDGISVQPLDDEAGFTILVVEAPPEDEDEAPVSVTEESDDEDLHEPE